MMQQRKGEFLFERCTRRRREFHALVPRCVKDEFLFGDVEEIEEFEIAVDDVELLFTAVGEP